MAKTLIIYAATALHAGLLASHVEPAREAGQSVRLVGAEFFSKGDTETNATAVVFVRRDPPSHVDPEAEGADDLMEQIAAADELTFQAICETYPDLEVADVPEGDVKIPRLAAEEGPVRKSEDPLKELRAELIGLGGSVPAGADAAQLADLIAAARADAAKADAAKADAAKADAAKADAAKKDDKK